MSLLPALPPRRPAPLTHLVGPGEGPRSWRCSPGAAPRPRAGARPSAASLFSGARRALLLAAIATLPGPGPGPGPERPGPAAPPRRVPSEGPPGARAPRTDPSRVAGCGLRGCRQLWEDQLARSPESCWLAPWAEARRLDRLWTAGVAAGPRFRLLSNQHFGFVLGEFCSPPMMSLEPGGRGLAPRAVPAAEL